MSNTPKTNGGGHECPVCHKVVATEKGLHMHQVLVHARRGSKRPMHKLAPARHRPETLEEPSIQRFQALRQAPGFDELMVLIKGSVAQIENWFERAIEAGVWTPEQLHAFRELTMDEFYRELFAVEPIEDPQTPENQQQANQTQAPASVAA